MTLRTFLKLFAATPLAMTGVKAKPKPIVLGADVQRDAYVVYIWERERDAMYWSRKAFSPDARRDFLACYRAIREAA